jgi:RNA polymerase sigma-70 factor (ECF subfamily)
VEIEAAGDIADSREDGFARTERGEIGRRVAAAMAKLPERQRAALALCYYEDLGNSEAAAVLEISIGALESLLVRGRRALRESLGDLAIDGGMG